MFQWAKNTFQSLRRWFYPIVDDDVVEIENVELAITSDNPKWKFDRQDVEQEGHFFFRGAILDELDTYFIYLRRMRRNDPEAYGLFSQIGIHLLPDQSLTSMIPPSSWLAGDSPSFGAVAFTFSDMDEPGQKKVNIKIAYFQKFGRLLPRVQAAPSSIFLVTYILDDRHDKKIRSGFPISYYCYLDPETKTFRLLREKHLNNWRYPPHLCECVEDSNRIDGDDKTSASVAHQLMCAISNFHEGSASALRITVVKDGLTGAFGIDTKRTAYFFKDRIKVKNAAGATQRIFHSVRAHERKTKSVRLHFRGLRDFMWKGYRIVISMPGLHHPDPMRFTAEATLSDRHRPGFASMKLLGKKIHQNIARAN